MIFFPYWFLLRSGGIVGAFVVRLRQPSTLAIASTRLPSKLAADLTVNVGAQHTCASAYMAPPPNPARSPRSAQPWGGSGETDTARESNRAVLRRAVHRREVHRRAWTPSDAMTPKAPLTQCATNTTAPLPYRLAYHSLHFTCTLVCHCSHLQHLSWCHVLW